MLLLVLLLCYIHWRFGPAGVLQMLLAVTKVGGREDGWPALPPPPPPSPLATTHTLSGSLGSPNFGPALHQSEGEIFWRIFQKLALSLAGHARPLNLSIGALPVGAHCSDCSLQQTAAHTRAHRAQRTEHNIKRRTVCGLRAALTSESHYCALLTRASADRPVPRALLAQ